MGDLADALPDRVRHRGRPGVSRSTPCSGRNASELTRRTHEETFRGISTCPGCTRSGRSACRSRPRFRSAGRCSARSTRPPTEPAGASTPCRCSSAACSAAASRRRWTGSSTAVAFLAFNAALFVLTFGLLYAQQHLPLNPDGKGSLGALGYKDTAGVDHPGADTGVVFNTVCSFVTNTNLQHYSGEQHLSATSASSAASSGCSSSRRPRAWPSCWRRSAACAATSTWATSTST